MNDIQNKKDQFNHKEVEPLFQASWKHHSVYSFDLSQAKKPFYNLMMFPYPSAEGLHVGNMYAFTGSDIYGRFKRLQGFDVFEPIGLDGFGIHSENYSIKIGRHPFEHAKITEKHFYEQLSKIGAMFDWNRTVETYKPNYYAYTQWLFVQLFKHGLVYRSKSPVNWCPSCKTVLADEQVIDGKCERCSTVVEKRDLEQWFFRITAYAERLNNNISALDWTEKVKIAQTNWIGKKTGIVITYPVVDEQGKAIGTVDCFTTRPDTNFGATFVVLAPEHPFINQLISVLDEKQVKHIQEYIHKTTLMSPDERTKQGRVKTGVHTGLYCINNLNGKKIPLMISDFVLMNFGTGAVVGVPGHDVRDFEFAQAMQLPILRVVVGNDGKTGEITDVEDVQEDEGVMIHSEFLDGTPIQEAIEKMMNHLESRGWGKRMTTYHLRDWLISRQRYWGPPIPMIYCAHCAKQGKNWFSTPEAKKYKQLTTDNLQLTTNLGWYPVSEDQLPVELPFVEDFKPGDDGVPPLKKDTSFYKTICPGCGKEAVRETEVSDTFLDSSWYFLRYPSIGAGGEESEKFSVPQLAKEKGLEMRTKNFPDSSPFNSTDNRQPITDNYLPWDPVITKQWLPVDMYTGGAEHSVLHLMYSRFMTMALHDLGYLDFEEPYKTFFAHGLVIKDGAKMSKSKGNVVNPDEYISTYGSDALRCYLMFMGPYSDGGDFRDSAMEGMYKWIGRVWRMAQQIMTSDQLPMTNKEITKSLHKLIKKVGEDVEKRQYNTSLAKMMEFTNLVAEKQFQLSVEDLRTFLILLAPFAPHVTEYLWQQTHGRTDLRSKEDSIHLQTFPTFDPQQLVDDMVTIIVQVNGKTRDSIEVSLEESADKQAIEDRCKKLQNVSKYINDSQVKKIIYVPRRLVNFVI